MKSLIQELKEMSTSLHLSLFGGNGHNVKLDMEQLILSGHSFGAMTAVTTAAKMPESEQPRAVTVIDPWLYALTDEYKIGRL